MRQAELGAQNLTFVPSSSGRQGSDGHEVAPQPGLYLASADAESRPLGIQAAWLGVKPSYSRPRVSDDNACAESLFRTAKDRPEFLAKGFIDLAAAREWETNFVRWYNVEHRHNGIRYVSPARRHAGDDHAILPARHEPYGQARALNPARWSRDTRSWTPIGAGTLNPERDSVLAMATGAEEIQPLAA